MFSRDAYATYPHFAARIQTPFCPKERIEQCRLPSAIEWGEGGWTTARACCRSAVARQCVRATKFEIGWECVPSNNRRSIPPPPLPPQLLRQCRNRQGYPHCRTRPPPRSRRSPGPQRQLVPAPSAQMHLRPAAIPMPTRTPTRCGAPPQAYPHAWFPMARVATSSLSCSSSTSSMPRQTRAWMTPSFHSSFPFF